MASPAAHLLHHAADGESSDTCIPIALFPWPWLARFSAIFRGRKTLRDPVDIRYFAFVRAADPDDILFWSFIGVDVTLSTFDISLLSGALSLTSFRIMRLSGSMPLTMFYFGYSSGSVEPCQRSIFRFCQGRYP